MHHIAMINGLPITTKDNTKRVSYSSYFHCGHFVTYLQAIVRQKKNNYKLQS